MKYPSPSSQTARRRSRPRSAAVAAGLAVALIAGACSSDDDSDARATVPATESGDSVPVTAASAETDAAVPATTAVPAAADTTVGDTAAADRPTLTIATSFAIDDLDPIANSFWGPEFGYVELLMRPERDGTPSPWVLEDMTATDDTTWELTLRDDVVFQNGTAFDAQGLVELIEFCGDNNESFAAAAQLESIEVTGDGIVTLTTKVPVPSLRNVLADESNVPVFDVAAYQAHLDSGAEPAALLDAGLYSGPYVMTSLGEQSAELVPIDNYWDGEPALSALTIKFVPEATSRVQAVQAGEADIALYMPTVVATTLAGRDDAFYVTGVPTGTTFSVQLRNAGAYADTAVRRALFAAIDYRALAEDVLDGQAAIAESVFGPTFPFSINTQVTDLDEANRLLDGAGWVMNGDGVRERDGETLTLRLLSYPQQPDSNTIAVAMQSQLGEVGFAVEVTEVPDLTAVREGDEWDAAIVGDSLMSFSLSPEDGLRSGLVTGGDQNFMQVSNAELDELVATLSTTFDEATRNDLLVQIQNVIHDNGLWAATIMRRPSVVTNAAWKGYEVPLANLWVTAKTAPSS